MAISVDWGTKVITIPKADLTLVQSNPIEIRSLDVNLFRLELKDLEDDETGMPFLDTHRHNTTVTVGGVTLARVFEIINGYTVTFEDGAYAVNLTGANNNIGDVLNLNTVSVRISNSAGLVTSAAIEYGEFDGAVHIDTINGFSGATYPTGTPRRPSNNFVEAKEIADFRGFDTIQIVGDYTFDSADTVNGFTFVGEGPDKTTIGLTSETSITNCIFRDATIGGNLDGGTAIINCHINDLNYVDGAIHESQLNQGTLTLRGSNASLINCFSGVPGTLTPIIDLGVSGTDLAVRNYHGGIRLTNHLVDSDDRVSIDMSSGHVIFDSSISAGTFTLRGIGFLTDSSNGTAVIDNKMISLNTISGAVWDDQLTDHDSTGTFGEALGLAGGGANPGTIAAAVWNAKHASFDSAGSFGERIGKKLLTKIENIYYK